MFQEVGNCWNIVIHPVSCLLVLNALPSAYHFCVMTCRQKNSESCEKWWNIQLYIIGKALNSQRNRRNSSLFVEINSGVFSSWSKGNGYNLEIIFFPMVGVSHRHLHGCGALGELSGRSSNGKAAAFLWGSSYSFLILLLMEEILHQLTGGFSVLTSIYKVLNIPAVSAFQLHPGFCS